MRKIVSIFLFALCGLFLGAAESCSNEPSPDLSDGVVDAAQDAGADECSSDDQCTTISEGCCDCFHGGSQKAVTRSKAKTLAAKTKSECTTTMCMAVISNHPSCAMKAKCENGACVLR